MFDDHRRPQLIDQPGGFRDEALRIGVELIEHGQVNTAQNVSYRTERQLRAFCNLGKALNYGTR